MKKLLCLPFFLMAAIGLLAKPVPPPKPEAPKPGPNPKVIAERLRLLMKQNGGAPPANIKELLQQQLQAQDQPLRRQVIPLPARRPQIRPVPNFIVPGGGRPIPQQPNIPFSRVRPKVEAVELLDGSRLMGKFVSFDPKTGLVWHTPHISPDSRINPASIAQVTFAPKKDLERKAQSTRVTFANGDELRGQLAGLDEKHLTLKTWYGGELKLDRNSVRTLVPGQTSANVIYEGPAKDDTWVFSNSQVEALKNRRLPNGVQLPPAVIERQKQQAEAAKNIKWAYQDGAFQSNGANAQVGRDFEMKNRVNFEFDIEWTSSLSLYVSLCTDNLKNYSMANTYSLRLTQSSAYMYRYEFGGDGNFRRSSRIGQTARYTVNVEPGKAPRAKVSIRIDKTKKEISLLINGMKVAQWQDTAANFAGKGNGIMFRASTSIPMRLANIRLSEWDGTLPGKVDISGGNPNEDFVRLGNNDTINGKLLAIGDGKVTFSTSFADKLPIPIGRVSVIKLAENEKINKPGANDVRFTLRNRGQVTATLKSWKDGKVTLASPAIGEATLDANVIEAMEFNLSKIKVAAANPKPAATSTSINVNGVNVLKGGLNINGGKIEIIPGGGIRIERNFKNQKIIPRLPQNAPIKPRRR